jgi:hypothetical protein
MATVTVTYKISDLTGREIEDESEVVNVVVDRHPGFTEPITLEALPDDIDLDALTEQAQEYVALRVTLPGSEPVPFTLPLTDFNNLFRAEGMDADSVLEQALATQKEAQRSSRRGGRRGGRQGTTVQEKPRIDYTSIDHAGEPHRGTISETEKQIVQENLDAVNARLREKGMREIDPTDPELARRYGLTQDPIEQAEIIEERPPAH